jgi:hypothetical protein
MDDDRIAELTNILIACHGADAEHIARVRQRRCKRRGEPPWEAAWGKVAKVIADQNRPSDTET